MASKEMTFETAMARLEEIVALLESGRCTLDESLKLFEEGSRLTAFCRKALETAEQKIIKLTAGGEDAPISDTPGEDMGGQLSE